MPSTDVCCLKTQLSPAWSVTGADRRRQWPFTGGYGRGGICICFRSIYQSLPRPALDRCDRVLVQIKFRKTERDEASPCPFARRDGVTGDAKKEKRKRKKLLLFDGWMKVKSADLTVMSSSSCPATPLWVFFVAFQFCASQEAVCDSA